MVEAFGCCLYCKDNVAKDVGVTSCHTDGMAKERGFIYPKQTTCPPPLYRNLSCRPKAVVCVECVEVPQAAREGSCRGCGSEIAGSCVWGLDPESFFAVDDVGVGVSNHNKMRKSRAAGWSSSAPVDDVVVDRVQALSSSGSARQERLNVSVTEREYELSE